MHYEITPLFYSEIFSWQVIFQENIENEKS